MSLDNGSHTSIEAQLALYWCELLGVEAVKRDDHFLYLGGNSMTATILANRIEDELGVRLSMDDLFTTLQGMALACESLLEEARLQSF